MPTPAPWLAYYGGMAAHIDYPDKTMWEMIFDAAAQWPDNTAYDFMNRRTPFRALPARIERVARALLAQGVRPGDRVMVCLPNCPQAVDTFYACNRIGALAAMIHPLSAPREIEDYLRSSRSRLILTLDQFWEKVRAAADAVQPAPVVVVTSIAAELPPLTAAAYRLSQLKKHIRPQRCLGWKSFLRAGAGTALLPCPLKAGDGAVILYSGGTTGTSKGILLSSRNFNALGLQTVEASGCKPLAGMTMLSVMPVFHGFGLGIGIHTPLIAGAACILVPQFSIDSYAKLVMKKRPSFIPGVPTLFEALLRAERLKNADLSFLRGVFCGGDTLTVELKRKVDAFLAAHGSPVQIREGYGTTECVTASCLTPVQQHREGSIGIPFPDMYYTITVPGTTDECPAGTEGEICLRGPTVMLGYFDAPEETAQALRRHADGQLWLHTGDLGMMDADGFVYFRQRIKRMIITSGYNVYPSQIENILDAHEKVLLSCVIGVKDDYRMQRVRAYVVPRPGVAPDEALRQELLAWCRERIARYAMPREILFRDELPKTLVGKVAYRVLEEQAAAEQAGEGQSHG